MKRTALFLLACTVCFSLSAVTLTETNDAWVIENEHYKASLGKKTGMDMRFSRINKARVSYAVGRTSVATSGEREKWDGQYCGDTHVAVSRAAMNIQTKVLSNTADKIVLELSGTYPAGTMKEVLTYDNTPVIISEVEINNTQRLGSHGASTAILMDSGKDMKVYPDGKFVPGVWHSHGDVVEGPSWRYFWYGRYKAGIGLIAFPGKDLLGIQYAQLSKQTGWPWNQSTMNAIHGRLGQYGVKGNHKFKYGFIVGGTPELAKQYSEALIGKDEKVSFFNYEMGKLVTRPGEDNKVIVDLRNTTSKAQDLTLKTTITYSLNTSKEVDSRKVTLAAGEYKELEIPIVFPKDAERGVAVRTDVLDADGKVVTTGMEFCSVSDFAPRDTGFGIINVGMAHQDGSQDVWNRNCKRGYVGAYEYYCWSPSVIGGLAPDYDQWIPQTEHNFRNVITKKFLKGLVDNAHSHGVGVYAWITGLWSYKEALKRPEWIQYNKEGQPAIYSGMVYPNGDRRIVVKPNMFYPDRAKAWAEEMADSVDMFGWDGCRWDWGFVPNAVCDPRYHETKADEWYNQDGVATSKLFPDPDTTGEECLKAWRKVMEERHPKFIFGTNYSSSANSWSMTPKYHKEAARNAVVLFEDMLGFNREEWNTFEKWGEELALRTDLVRPHNAAPVVGSMRGVSPHSVSSELAHYTCESAGVKWWAGSSYVLSNSRVRGRYFVRFAEWYYDTKFLRPEKCPVSLVKNTNILFKPFTRERATADGREVVVPIVNMPEENGIVCEFHKKPPVRTFSLKLDAKKGEKVTAWLMTPENPEKAVELKVTDNTVTVPDLNYAAMVLFQCKGGK